MKFKRTGDDVDVTGHGTVEHGETVDFDPSFTDGLTGQDGWEHVVDRKRSKAAKKAAGAKVESGTSVIVGEKPEFVSSSVTPDGSGDDAL
jgi:hypothetical protein